MDWLVVRGTFAGVLAISLFFISWAALAVCVPLLMASMWIWGFCEVLFAVHYGLLLVRDSKELYPNSKAALLPDDYDPQITKQQLLRHVKRVSDIKQSMKSWFINAGSWDEIKRRNLKELFAYAIWYKTT